MALFQAGKIGPVFVHGAKFHRCEIWNLIQLIMTMNCEPTTLAIESATAANVSYGFKSQSRQPIVGTPNPRRVIPPIARDKGVRACLPTTTGTVRAGGNAFLFETARGLHGLAACNFLPLSSLAREQCYRVLKPCSSTLQSSRVTKHNNAKYKYLQDVSFAEILKR